MKKLNLLLLTAVFIFTAPAAILMAQSVDIKPAKQFKPVHFDISKKLIEVTPVPPTERGASWKGRVIKNELGMYEEFEQAEQWTGPDPLLQDELPSSRSQANVNENFAGVPNLNGVAPPDTDGDAGPNHYFQMINLSFEIFDKSGNSVYGPADNNTLWDGFDGPWSSTNDGDPIVLYDQFADRWIVSQFALPNYPSGPFYELIAVSATSDPTGEWYRYAYQFDNLPDYPKFGVWPDGYYMSVNFFSPPLFYFAGAGICAFDRDAMIAGEPNAGGILFTFSSYFSFLPSDADGSTMPPAGAPNYFINLGPNALRIFEVSIDWDTPANSTASLEQTLTTAPFSNSGIVIDQPGTNEGLDDLSDRLMYRLQYRNFGTHQTMVTNHTVNADGNGRAGVRWYELRNTGNGWSIYQQGTYAPDDGNGRWMGSVAMNGSGEIAAGYSVSGPSTYPSIRVAGQTSSASNGPGNFDVDETHILDGSSSQTNITGERWGDYSMMSVDPSDDHTFWFTTEYTTGGWNWKTQIASFDFSPVVVVAPVADFTADPLTVMEGQSVSFSDQSLNNPTSWEWTFEGGIPGTSTERNPVVTYNTIGEYDVMLKATNSAGSNTLTKQNYVTVTEFVLDWCSSASTNYSQEYISNVSFNNINNSSTGSTYTFFENQTVEVQPGQTYDLSLTPWTSGKSRREFWRVWIDYNMDGDFTDNGELVFAADNKKSSVSGQVTIPQDAEGLTRMRVSMRNGSAPPSCGTFTFGEVEDYPISISAPTPQAPVADFTSDITEVLVGGTVNFTDLSSNNPTSWLWSFTGGTPDKSSVQNPAVAYNTAGTYQVSLTASNEFGDDVETKTEYINVVTEVSGYCDSGSESNALDWITQVEIGSFSNPSEANTYTDYTGLTINLTPGQDASVLLTPGFSGNSQREFWRIWIDYNQDGDFEDSGEQVFAVNNKKTPVSGTFTVPSDMTGQTRLRVSMKNGSSPSPCETFTYGEVEDYTVSFGGTSKPIADGQPGQDDQIMISPNPGNGVFKLTFSEKLIPGCEIRVVDMTGKMVERIYLVENSMDIDISSHGKGIYQLIVLNGKKQYNAKAIVQ